jgi:hypothetical protein
MPIELDDRGRALENEYFRRREQELLDKMKQKLESEAASATQMSCPRCGGDLIETDHDNVTIDVCNKCNGVWLDAGELAQIAAKDEENGGWFGKLFS